MKGVIFDVDGVLCESSVDHYLAWRRLAADLGFELPSTYQDRLRGISRQASLELVLQAGDLENKFTQEQFQALSDQKNHYFQERIEAITPEFLAPGARALLEQLKERNILLATASASRNAKRLLEKLEISCFFNFMVDPAKIHHPKPHPMIFSEAAKGLGLAPEECIGIEDAPAGIESIIKAGMLPIGIGDPLLLKEATSVFPDLKSATPTILQLVKE